MKSRVIASLALLSLADVATAKDRWYEVTTPHFVVVSNDKETDALEVAEQFEQIRSAFQMALPRARTGSLRLHILAVKNEKSLKQLLPEYWKKGRFRPAGIFRSDGSIALRTDVRGPNPYSLIYHEYFHAIVDLNAPGVPSWLNEGMASYWENTELRDDRIVVGLPSGVYVRLLKEKAPIPLAELFATAPTDHSRRASMFYAQSWALTHYFMIGGRQTWTHLLQKYIELVHEGNSSVEAAEKAFGEFDDLANRLRPYIASPTFSAMSFPRSASVDPSTFTVREISEGESLAVRGYFLVRGGNLEEGGKLLDKAVDDEPISTIAREAMGFYAARQGRDEDAERWLAQAVAAPDASHTAHFLYAVRQPTSPDKEAEFLKAISLERSYAPAYVGLGFYYAEVDQTLERSLAMVRAAAGHEPGSAAYRLMIARVLRKMGDPEKASAEAKTAVRLATWSRKPSQTNNTCWFGSLTGFAREVLDSCEMLLELYPNVPAFADSRGLAYALVGQNARAITDFEVFANATDRDPDDRELRKQWIRALEKGDNPFDEETLARLLDLPF